ncbi:unnamed protein product [Aspergillus oryzae]|nr:unnamed protein product [Aspergillus oryzae]
MEFSLTHIGPCGFNSGYVHGFIGAELILAVQLSFDVIFQTRDKFHALSANDFGGGKREKLIDTAVSIYAATRQPTQADFIPIEHISLDSKNKKAEKLDLDIPSDNVFWIKSFFILHNLQGKRIGGATMNEIERIATQEPLCAKTLMLDTVERDQLREDFAKVTYGGVPKVNLIMGSQLDINLTNKSAVY